jgi:hypothetical protein
MRFMEAATTGDFPSLLRADYEDIVLSAYGSVNQPEQALCYEKPSDQETETYRGLKHIQDLDEVVPQGAEIPEVLLGEKSTAAITNYKYARIASVTKEMVIYNKLSEFTRLASAIGDAMGRTISKKIAAAIETSGNYTAYGSTLTLTRANVELMLTKFKTQTATAADGSSVKLALIPDTILVPPDLTNDAERIVGSVNIPGSANNDINVLRGKLRIVESPWLSSSTVWYLMKTNWVNGLVLQKVIGPPPENSIQDVNATQSDSVFRYDKISYKTEVLFGVGVVDAKSILRSTS